jgi:hypothetical protein
MTEQTMWRILDAWRQDKSRVAYSSGVMNKDVYPIRNVTKITQLLNAPSHWFIKWFIDGVEITNE